MKKVTKIKPALSVFLFLALFPSSSFAYLDPGTGSMILQGLIGAVAVGLATGKMWWYRIKGMFTSNDVSEQEEKDQSMSQETKTDD